MDRDKILRVKSCTAKLLALNELEEKVLKQRSKIEWLKLGDGNNSFFHASLRAKHVSKGMHLLYREDGTMLKTQKDIEQVVVAFYESLMGTAVIPVSYRFNVNGVYTKIMQAKRGLRQGDPLSPMMFAIMMEGDMNSVEHLLKVLQQFSSSTGLVVNPSKCRLFLGGVDSDTRIQIQALTTFQDGELPFRYLGVPMTSKRLDIQHYSILIDKIVARVVKHINSICRSFVWTGGTVVTRKSPVAWHSVCKPRKNGGLNVLDLQYCSDIALMKLL
ncbi:uncharacterized protein LOC131648481 [Vicia villosa]|uniref:uncharacterized protein LOC131648481 n=1 Tax=Vicia villosa TaxID=3911 RepID=UPI00273B266F|nr:uncharacterized protein LOC131648481 [Vicia villosa]